MKEQILNAGIRLTTIYASEETPYYLDNVTKSYSGTAVIDRENILLPKTGLLLLTGDSGAGKTTFFNLLAGLLKPDSGTLTGFEQAKISYMFQEDRLLPWYTVQENMNIIVPAERAAQWLRITGLEAAAQKFPKELSGGMKRRAALSRAMAYGGDIILLDEPFNGVDAELKNFILQKILSATKDALLIISTHEEDIISQLTKMDETMYH